MTIIAASDVGGGEGRPDLAAPRRVVFVQDGARLRYALPLALQSAGILDVMHTDWYVRQGSTHAALAAVMAKLPYAVGRRLAGRRSTALDDRKIFGPFWTSLLGRLSERRTSSAEELYIRRSDIMARHVLRHGWGNADALVGFVRNIDPLLCERARRRGMAVILDQMIAPITVEQRAAERQAALWPGWERPIDATGPLRMREVERRSWAAADHITCASDYVRRGLIDEGVDPDRISVLPYPIDTGMFAFHDRSCRSDVVRIGFVGAVSLRKGAPAFLKVAHVFDPKVAEFVMIGPHALDEARLAQERGGVRLVGAVPAATIPGWLQHFDVLLFPSTCEGSAGAVMEAMATGLPIVTTRESGTLVRDGVDGFLHGPEDIEGMTHSIARLIADPGLRSRMGRAARSRVEPMTIERYGRLWRELLERLL